MVPLRIPHLRSLLCCPKSTVAMNYFPSKKYDIPEKMVSFTPFNCPQTKILYHYINFVYVTVTEYFKGDNWRVHPDWVYCEYNSVSDLEKERESSGEYANSRDQEPSFSSPEEQVLHFLSRAGRPGWKWMSVSIRLSQQNIFNKTNLNMQVLIILYYFPTLQGTAEVSPTAP